MNKLQIQLNQSQNSKLFHNLFQEITITADLQQIRDNYQRIFVDTNNLIGYQTTLIKNAFFDPLFQENLEKNIKILEDKANQLISITLKKFKLLIQNTFKITAVFDRSPLCIKKQVKLRVSTQKSKSKKAFFIRLLSKIQTQIILFLIKYKVKVKFAPNESDYLILRECQLKRCDLVLSEDHIFIQHKKPTLILLTTSGQNCKLIDLNLWDVDCIKNKKLKSLVTLVQNPFKRAMYRAIKGSKKYNHRQLPFSITQSFSIEQILQYVHKTDSLSQLFDMLEKKFSWNNVKFDKQYRETAEYLRLFDLLGTCLDSETAQIAYTNPSLAKKQFKASGITESRWKQLMGNVSSDFEEQMFKKITQCSREELCKLTKYNEVVKSLEEQCDIKNKWITIYSEEPTS